MRDSKGRFKNGHGFTQSMIKKMSEAKRGKPPWNKGKKGVMPPSWNKGKKGIMPTPWNKKSILQYSIEGIFIKEWNSINTASTELNLNHGDISNCINGKRITSGNFVWKRKANNYPLQIEVDNGKYHYKPVLQYSLQGEFIRKWNSIKEACQTNGYKAGGISLACKKLRSAYGFMWVAYNKEILEVIPAYKKAKPIFKQSRNPHLKTGENKTCPVCEKQFYVQLFLLKSGRKKETHSSGKR